MKASQFHIFTRREVPAGAEIVSHQLMLRAGMIRRLTSGIYSWTPMGLKVLRRVEQVVREEMNAAGALEMLMPAVQPAELWEETGRWDDFGPLLLKMTDHAGRQDRKSTRLNSSHVAISYAVFCLKKKKEQERHI